jgi:hypothetical protein
MEKTLNKKRIANLILWISILFVMSFASSRPWASSSPVTEIKIDDFEDQSHNGFSPERTNLWGGQWAVTLLNSSIGVSYDGPGISPGRYCAGVTGKTGPYGYAIFQCPLSSKRPNHWDVPYDLACHGLIGIQFWMKGDGNTYRMDIPSKAVTDGTQKGDWYGVDFTPPAGAWAFFNFPFSSLTRKQWMGTGTGLPEHPDGSDVIGIQFYTLNPGPFAYSLDQISFYGSYIPQCFATPSQTAPPLPTQAFTPIAPQPTNTPPPSSKVIPPTPRMTPTWLSKLDKANTVEFTTPPAVINITFADGPGFYQVKVADDSGNILKQIFDQKVVALSDSWIEWDGRDKNGKAVMPGQYYVILYKDGKALKSLSVIRDPTGH